MTKKITQPHGLSTRFLLCGLVAGLLIGSGLRLLSPEDNGISTQHEWDIQVIPSRTRPMKIPFEASSQSADEMVKHQAKVPFTSRDLTKFLAQLKDIRSSEEFKKRLDALYAYALEPGDTSLSEAIGALLVRWTEVDPNRAWEELDHLQGVWGIMRFFYKDSMLKTWAAQDIESLKQAFEQGAPSLKGNPELLPHIARQWAESSPEDAWAWLQTRTPGEIKKGLREFFRGVHTSSPEQLGKFLSRVNFSDDKSLSYEDRLPFLEVVSMWGASSPEDALRWAQSLPPFWKDSFISQIVTSQGHENPESIFAHIDLIPNKDRKKILERLADSVIMLDPKIAAPWMEQAYALYPDLNLNASFSQFFYSLPKKDSQEIIQNLPEGHLKTHLEKSLLKTSSAMQP